MPLSLASSLPLLLLLLPSWFAEGARSSITQATRLVQRKRVQPPLSGGSCSEPSSPRLRRSLSVGHWGGAHSLFTLPGRPDCLDAERISCLAETLDQLELDVYVLSRLGDAAILDQLLARMRQGYCWHVGGGERGLEGYTRAGIISRIPLMGPPRGIFCRSRAGGERGQESCLVSFDLDGSPGSILAVRLPTASSAHRELQAVQLVRQVLRGQCDWLQQHPLVAVTGNFGDQAWGAWPDRSLQVIRAGIAPEMVDPYPHCIDASTGESPLEETGNGRFLLPLAAVLDESLSCRQRAVDGSLSGGESLVGCEFSTSPLPRE